jgi:type I restriction enzyme, S subunit
MREGWEECNLEDYVKFIDYRGRTPVKTTEGIRLITAKNVKLGYLQLEPQEFIHPDSYDSWMTRGIPKVGDVIFTTEAPLGNVAQLDTSEKVAFAQRIIVMQPQPKKIDQAYLKFMLSTQDVRDRILGQGTGATVQGIKASLLRKIPIQFPTLAEQQRIVAILDEAFAAISQAKANAEQNLKNARELFESYLQGVFEQRGEGWEETTLEDVCEISSKLVDPKRDEFQNLIHVGAGNIESQKGTLVDLMTAKEEGLISGKFLFDETMVLYSKIRPYLMKVVRCEFAGMCSADIYPLLPLKNKLIRDFLYYLLLTAEFTDYAIKGSARAGMPKVNREHLFAYRFSLPPITEQKSIVQKLDALSAETKRLEAIYQQKVASLEELKKTVLQKAFRGELNLERAMSV